LRVYKKGGIKPDYSFRKTRISHRVRDKRTIGTLLARLEKGGKT